tara:strand:- start:1465 stop:1818 length:354 start_codon:yes stop_codon:yes gene_type:complete
MNKNDPNYLSHEYYKNLVAYQDAKRILKNLIKIQKRTEDQQYDFYRFKYNEKMSSEDAKRKASIDPKVTEQDDIIEQTEAIVDKHYALMQGLIWTKDLTLDSAATKRKEMEFVKIET